MGIEKRIKDFIEKYKLEKLPLYEGTRYVGYLDANLAYTKGHLYYLPDRDAELEIAGRMLPIIEEVINGWNKPISVRVYKYVDRLKVAVEDWNGTLDEVFENFETINNKLRYCNGDYYELVETPIKIKYRIWHDLNPYSRSFALYYGNGTVD